jgi:hypothetical protein
MLKTFWCQLPEDSEKNTADTCRSFVKDGKYKLCNRAFVGVM